MDVSALRSKLIAEGCNENNFAIQTSGNDVFCLDIVGRKWTVFYMERGKKYAPIFKSSSESEACQFFYDYIMKMEHRHMVGFFDNEADATNLEKSLRKESIKSIRNDIPAYQTLNDPRYRVFVLGKDVFKFRELFGKEALKSC